MPFAIPNESRVYDVSHCGLITIAKYLYPRFPRLSVPFCTCANKDHRLISDFIRFYLKTLLYVLIIV